MNVFSLVLLHAVLLLLLVMSVLFLVWAVGDQLRVRDAFDPCLANMNVSSEDLWGVYPECVVLRQEREGIVVVNVSIGGIV